MGPATPLAFDSSSWYFFVGCLGLRIVLGNAVWVLLRDQICELELSPFRSLPLSA